MPRTNKPLPPGKDTAAKAKCDALGLTIKESKQVERTNDDGEVKLENLITVELQDGTTLTVDADNPEHPEVIERASNRVARQIDAGQRPAKQKPAKPNTP